MLMKTNEKIIVYSIFKGFTSAFNLSAGNLITRDDLKNGLEKDKKAIAGDWVKVGAAIKSTFDREICCHE